MKQSVSVQTFPMCNCVKIKKKKRGKRSRDGRKRKQFPHWNISKNWKILYNGCYVLIVFHYTFHAIVDRTHSCNRIKRDGKEKRDDFSSYFTSFPFSFSLLFFHFGWKAVRTSNTGWRKRDKTPWNEKTMEESHPRIRHLLALALHPSLSLSLSVWSNPAFTSEVFLTRVKKKKR